MKKLFWNVYTKIIIGVVLFSLFAAGGVNYYSKKESDARYLKVADAVDLTPVLNAKADTAGQEYTGSQVFTNAILTAPVNSNIGVIQFQDNALKTNTGNTNENKVGTYTIRGGIGANGSIEILWFAQIQTSANASTFRVYVNGVLVGTATLSANTHAPLGLYVWNTNNTQAQSSAIATAVAGMTWAANSNAMTTYTFNTNADMTVAFTIQASNSSYTGYIHRIKCVTYYSN